LKKQAFALAGKGFVAVDEQLWTSAKGVYAVGDCAGSPHFTHIGYDEFRVVFSHLTEAPRSSGTTGHHVPSTLFTHPELARVGLRESEAQAKGLKYRLAKLPMGAFLRTRTMDEPDGFAKAVVKADGDQILGFTALGPNSGELLPVVQLAMKLGIRYQEIADLTITHPTMCEWLAYLFSAVPAKV
jgi:pyruvate/2-oxoglutarate dehydrogenase complex dihydrolipoamide dehydrogenase (E3) component